MPTNVPTPVFTPTGFVPPTELAVLTGVQQDINTAFGGNLNFGTTAGSPTNPTPQGQLAASMAAIIGNANDTFLFYTTQTDPAYAEGRMQDAIGRIYFMERIGAIATTLQVLCVGAVNTIIPVGSQIIDPNGNIYSNNTQGVIGIGGSVGIQFTANVPGFIAVPTTVVIYQSIAGWDTATLISGIAGQDTETRAAFEARRGLATAQNSIGSLPSVQGALLNVPGVLAAFVYENTNPFTSSFGGVQVAPNSLYVSVFGGAQLDVATAIWSRKAPGCAYNGNTTVTVTDTSTGYAPPFPTYQVSYTIPQPLPIQFQVNMVNSAQVPSNATALIQNAIITAGAGNPNANNVIDGPKATIGSLILSTRFAPSIAALGAWAEGQILSINIGSSNNVDAAFCFGTCNGTLMNVTSLVTGTLSVGQTLSDGSNVILAGTTILAQVSGTVGGTGFYTISQPNTFTTATLIGASLPNTYFVQVNINQIPIISAPNIVVNYLVAP